MCYRAPGLRVKAAGAISGSLAPIPPACGAPSCPDNSGHLISWWRGVPPVDTRRHHARTHPGAGRSRLHGEELLFSDWAAHRLTDDVALLTYRATQDGSCGGQALPGALVVSSVYVRRGGSWMNAAYHETPARPSGM